MLSCCLDFHVKSNISIRNCNLETRGTPPELIESNLFFAVAGLIRLKFRITGAFYSRPHRERLKRQEAEEEAEEVITRGAARSILKGIQPTFH